MKCWKSCAENKENPCFGQFRSMDFLWFFTESWGKSSLGARLRTRKVRGRDAALPAPLLTASLGLVGLGTVGALPQTPQGTLSLAPARGRRKGTKSPLDPFSRLGWSHFHAPSVCSFLVLRLSPCLLPTTFREEPFYYDFVNICRMNRAANSGHTVASGTILRVSSLGMFVT